jgi:hypothetical protein
MKDNLLPFNLEEAKKDPSRIRFITPIDIFEVHFWDKQPVITMYTSLGIISKYDKDAYEDLGLTPKRMFVKLYEGANGWRGCSSIFYSSKEAYEYNSVHGNCLGTYELIPVEEK